MAPINDLIEWNDCGASHSVYIKHFVDEEGKRGMTLIYEDLTHDKVTEITIPTNKFPVFLHAVNEGSALNNRLY
ncbi:MAG: hypothetical protein ACI9E5_001244 [Candidatus Omnitrophota bacterium]|jgi:hypothetical protein